MMNTVAKLSSKAARRAALNARQNARQLSVAAPVEREEPTDEWF